MLNKKLIVLSGANITSGGPISIFNDALRELSQNESYEIIAIVGNSEMFFKSENVSFITIPYYKKFIFLKFYYEYIYYKKLSKKIKPDVWISLNDFSPNVSAKSVFTYFHNAAIFFEIEWKDILFSKRVILQKMYYNFFLKFNISKNKRFIIQQNWIAKSIQKKYKLPLEHFLIFKPSSQFDEQFKTKFKTSNENIVVFYPTKAVGYKNIEFICEALDVVYNQYSIKNIELRLTIDKEENDYSKYLKRKYQKLPIVWLGTISKDEVESNYQDASVLVFPSRLETWGLPLTEFAKYNKPIFAIDLGYVYETLENYAYLAFFKPNDVNRLVELLMDLIGNNNIEYYSFEKKSFSDIQSIKEWKELLDI